MPEPLGKEVVISAVFDANNTGGGNHTNIPHYNNNIHQYCPDQSLLQTAECC